MRQDFLATGKCNLQLGKEFMNIRIAWAVRKSSPYAHDLNVAFMKMHERGLINMWYNQFVPDAHQCLAGSNGNVERIAPYSLKDLSGAFIILLSGYCLALVAIIFEKLAIIISKIHSQVVVV